MTIRERRLAYIILSFIVLAAGGFFGYQFYLEPMKTMSKQIGLLEYDIEQQEGKIKEIAAAKKRLASLREISLPYTPNTQPDAELGRRTDLARRTYVANLTKMLRD